MSSVRTNSIHRLDKSTFSSCLGEAVLNLSQGTVSEILSKPRPWHSLSVKGREPYMRMYTWYHDTDNVQKLLAWKRERDGKNDIHQLGTPRIASPLALRRSRPASLAPLSIKNDAADGDAVNSNTTFTTGKSASTNRAKRRCLFTDDQRRALKQIFENEPYPGQATLEQLVVDLSLPMNKIANWFHNSRMRAKTAIRPSMSPTHKLSSPPLTLNDDLANTHSDDDDGDLVDNNNNNHNDGDEDDDDDDDDDDDYSLLPTIVPLTR